MFTALAQETRTAIAALDAIASATHPIRNFGDGYKQIGVNFSIEACEAAAEITGYDLTFSKMLNYRFRTDAVNMILAQVNLAAKNAAKVGEAA